MKIPLNLILSAVLFQVFACEPLLAEDPASKPGMTKPVKALADRVRGHVNSQPLRFPNQHWVRGAYYAGLMAMYESTSDGSYPSYGMAVAGGDSELRLLPNVLTNPRIFVRNG